MVELVDNGDAAGVQVQPQEVGPHPHAALQPVGLLEPRQLAVHIQAHCSSWGRGRFTGLAAEFHAKSYFMLNFKVPLRLSYLSGEVGGEDHLQQGSALSGEKNKPSG